MPLRQGRTETLLRSGAACRQLGGNMSLDKCNLRPLQRRAPVMLLTAIIWATCWQTFQRLLHPVLPCLILTLFDPFLMAPLTTALFREFL